MKGVTTSYVIISCCDDNVMLCCTCMKGLMRQEQFQGFWCKSTLLMLANGRKESLTENIEFVRNMTLLGEGNYSKLCG